MVTSMYVAMANSLKQNDQAENGPAEAGHADEATEENKPAEGHATEEPQIPQPADLGLFRRMCRFSKQQDPFRSC